MISPTGDTIRSDSEGDGHLGASRGERKHRGVDYLCKEGQVVVAPFDMLITRVSNPKTNSPMTGIAWVAGDSEGRLWYFRPYAELIGKRVKQGDAIGVAQSVSHWYKLKNMSDHIHFQVNK